MVDELSARGVESERIVTVPNGVDGALLDENLSPREARALLGLGVESSFLVGAVSALVDYEGFDARLRAAALVGQGAQSPAPLRRRRRGALAGAGTAAAA